MNSLNLKKILQVLTITGTEHIFKGVHKRHAGLALCDGSALLLTILTGHTGALLSGHHLTLLAGN